MVSSSVEPKIGCSGAPLFAALRDALAEHFLHEEGVRLEALDEQGIAPRRFSTVRYFLVRTSAGSRRLVAKTTVHHDANRAATERENQALVEFRVLQRLYPRFKETEQCSVARPLLVLAERETYVMEFVEGGLLADQLGAARWLGSPRRFRTVSEYLYRCGCWLRHFQEFTEPRLAGPEAAAGVVRLAEHWLDLLEEAGQPHRMPALTARVRDFVRKQYDRLTGMQIPVAGRHGDFGPWNVLVGSNGVTGLDFLGYQEDVTAVDPLHMLVALEREKACLGASARRVTALQKRFCEGFGLLRGAPEPLLVLCETAERLRTVHECLAKHEGTLQDRLARRFRLRTYVRWLENPVAEISLWPMLGRV
jgi:hypothetical protein